ncbi:Retrovirus-related Pol polyprotein from transposon TNT 1-94 [Frankliniella fusca]|uniref:Retrovirus-related Pol polyprotein from transposon TNT 1-94 n=1 Tax=Frankliniella fusca TaxID=407009 RepID=A0AAE1LS97_9NEOP|nr:Retrovirus-related Pol polyprotein from transposon TNT 1-94 [Frankliniella fusca]
MDDENSSNTLAKGTVKAAPPQSQTESAVNLNVTPPPFKKLKGEENWADWRHLMELYLADQFSCTFQDPPPEVLADRKCRAFQEELAAKQKISFGIEEELLKYIRGATTAHQIWTKLCHAFEDKGVYRRAALLRKLVSLKQTSTLSQYVIDFRDIVNQIANTGKAVEDELTAVLLLANVKQEHKPFCQIIEKTCLTKLADGTTTLEFKVVSEELLREGNKIKTEEKPDGSNALMASRHHRSSSSSSKTWHAKRNQHPHAQDKRNNNERVQQKRRYPYGSFPPCKWCSKTNHPEKECYFKKNSATYKKLMSNKNRDEKPKTNETPKQTKKEEAPGPSKWVLKIAKRKTETDYPTASKKLCPATTSNPDVEPASHSNTTVELDVDPALDDEYWLNDANFSHDNSALFLGTDIDMDILNENKIVKMYVDSGAFSPMTNDLSNLHEYKETPSEPIECAGDQVLYTKGIGIMKLATVKDDVLKSIPNTIYIPNLSCNLLSVTKITPIPITDHKMDPVKQTNTEIEQGPNNNAQLLSDTSDNKASGLCDNTQTTKITETKNTPLQDQSNTAQNFVPQDQADQESTFWDEFPIQNNSNNDPHNTTSDNRETIKTKPPSHHTTLPMDSGSECRERRKRKPKQFPDYIKVTIFSDSKNAIGLGYSQQFSARNKHLGVRVQLIRDCIQDGILELEHLSSQEMPADMLTKSLVQANHKKCCDAIKLFSD